MSVDPLTKSYPWYTPYQFAGNMPIQARDLDGLEPLVEGGILIGYNVQKGQGPTHISLDLNDPKTQEKYGYTLLEPVEWHDIVYANQSKFQNVVDGSGQLFDKNNLDFWSGNINPNDKLNVFSGLQAEPNPPISPPDVPKPETTTDDAPNSPTFSWDNPAIRLMTSDFFSISVGAEGMVGVGSGGTIGLVWTLHGPDKSIIPGVYASTSVSAGAAANASAGIYVGQVYYLGPANEINNGMIVTDTKNNGDIPTISIGGDAYLGVGGGIGLDYTHLRNAGSNGEDRGLLGGSINIGVGVGGGNSVGLSNTYKVEKKKNKTP